jgi:sugar phosphate isomerase/epimerase
MKKVNEDNVALMIDTFHANIEEVSMLSAVEEAEEKLQHVHVADNNRLPPGFGSIDFKTVLAQLMHQNYGGFLGIECMPMGPEIDSLLRKSLNHLKATEQIVEARQ